MTDKPYKYVCRKCGSDHLDVLICGECGEEDCFDKKEID